MIGSRLLVHLRHQQGRMLDELDTLVTAESPSAEPVRTAECGQVLADIAGELIGRAPVVHDVAGRSHLEWRFGGPTEILLVGHLDTVWPAGTVASWPFTVADGIARGPGVVDMKAGLVQALHVLASLDDLTGLTLLVTADEELGSPTSRSLIETRAVGARAVLVLEPSADGGALKTARKGVSIYQIRVQGRSAHAGLEPEKGANALVELAHVVLVITELADRDAGTTVTPTLATAGTAGNVVPEAADLTVDVRAATQSEQERVHVALQAVAAHLPDMTVTVDGGPNRPPMPAAASADLFARARRLAADLGLGDLRGVAVGGGSDGNLTASLGVPTLDGLGAVGGGAHARAEHVIVETMPERAALVAALVDDLRNLR